MASLGMEYGPYAFTKEGVKKIPAKKSPGNYALGYLRDGDFFPKYVGRSDTDLLAEVQKRLEWAGKYSHFKCDYASSVKAAFEKECNNYHDFERQLDNERHPDRPDGTDYQCPRCDALD